MVVFGVFCILHIIYRTLVNSLAPGKSGCDSKNGIFNLVLLIGIFRSPHDNTLRWMPQDLTDNKSTLVQVIAWCRQATSHYPSQCWPGSLSPNGITKPQWVKKRVLFRNQLSWWSVWQWFPGIENGRLYPSLQRRWKGGNWFHLVRLSVCGQNRVRSVSSTILIGSISYLHILSSNFRRCVACNGCFKIQKFEILANSLNL